MDIKTLCLGILSIEDATGYEIKKIVEEGSFSFFSEASYGSIYPALSKLHAEGLIDCQTKNQAKKPDKKIYSLTESGRRFLIDALQEKPLPDKTRSDFLASLMFAESIAPDRIKTMITDRLGYHEKQLAQLQKIQEEQDDQMIRFVLGYGIAVQKAARDYIKNYINNSAL